LALARIAGRSRGIGFSTTSSPPADDPLSAAVADGNAGRTPKADLRPAPLVFADIAGVIRGGKRTGLPRSVRHGNVEW
jgi:hypothetical protein